MGPSSSFVDHQESLDVFLQPFSFRQKAECHVQESSRKPRLMKSVSENLRSAKKDPPQDLSDPSSARNQELDQSCVLARGRKLLRNSNQNPTMYSQENKVTVNLLAPGNWDGEMNLQIQPTPGNWITSSARSRRTTNWYRSVEDQRVDLGTVYVDNNESRHSPWTKFQ